MLKLHETCLKCKYQLKQISISWEKMSQPIKGRNSHPVMFCKKGARKNFEKFIGKYLCQSLYFSEHAGLRSANLLKKSLWHRSFPINFTKFLTKHFYKEHLRWLLLKRDILRKIGLKLQNPYRDHSFRTCVNFCEKLTFLTPWYAEAHLSITG